MDESTMALLTGLIATTLGFVLIGGALVAAFMIGRERGRREVRDGGAGELGAGMARLRLLEEGYLDLRHDLEQATRQLEHGADTVGRHEPLPSDEAPPTRR